VRERIKNIFHNSKKNIDAIIIKNSNYPFIDNNLFYVTGLSKGLFEGSLAILYPDGTINLIVSKLEAETASKSNLNISIYKDKKEFEEIVEKLTSSLKVIGINCMGISYSEYYKIKKLIKKSRFVDVSDSFVNTRLVKDKNEIQQIKKACNISDDVMKKIPDLLCEGMHEYEIAAEIDYLMQKLGADKPAFDTISSFNKNTAEPHYSHGKTLLNKGYFTLFDFGANYQKYNSDITRTFVFGKSDKKQREMYETVLSAQQTGLDIIKAGISGDKVHNAVEKYINNTKFKGCFIHSTGHSLGINVHDGSAGLSPKSKVILKENMVFTVEPGVYIPGYGGVRIEDDIIVKKDGIELLTKAQKDFIEI